MVKNLSEFKTFPDLRNWEDSDEKISKAYKAIEELNHYLKCQKNKEYTGNKITKEKINFISARKASTLFVAYEHRPTDYGKNN